MKLHEAREAVRLSSELAGVEHSLDAIRHDTYALTVDVEVFGKRVDPDVLIQIRASVRNHLDRCMTYRLQTIRDRLDELGVE